VSDTKPLRPIPDDPNAFVDLASLSPASEAEAIADGVWDLREPFPTTLIGLWPEETPPDVEAITRAFAAFVGEPVAVIEDLPPHDAAIHFSRVLAVPGLPAPVIVWAEPARQIDAGELPDPALASARWVVGCESLLSINAPLDDFIALMRLLAGSIPALPAVLDAMTRQWFLADELLSLFLADEPTATEEVLWRIHAIGRSEEIGEDDRVWLYTVGLWRCGKPELEILELPGRHVSAGVTLLNGIAALAVAGPVPTPDAVAVVGQNLRVRFRPWREVVPFLDPSSVGSLDDRSAAADPDEPNPLMGVRAVLCDAEPKGTYRKIWTWPERAIAELEGDRAAIYLSDRSTQQVARVARSTWPLFAEAWVRSAQIAASMRSADFGPPAFLVKAAFEHEEDRDRGREHLWFEVLSLDHEGAAEATLINDPQIATHLQEGDRVRIDPREVSDWRVLLPETVLGPRHAALLDGAIEGYRAAVLRSAPDSPER
jgi:uncharacterized protein YegJ (DUF2314 family)